MIRDLEVLCSHIKCTEYLTNCSHFIHIQFTRTIYILLMKPFNRKANVYFKRSDRVLNRIAVFIKFTNMLIDPFASITNKVIVQNSCK